MISAKECDGDRREKEGSKRGNRRDKTNAREEREEIRRTQEKKEEQSKQTSSVMITSLFHSSPVEGHVTDIDAKAGGGGRVTVDSEEEAGVKALQLKTADG